MLLRSLQLSFGTIRHMILGEILFEEFQDGCHGGHLGSEQYDFSNSEYSCPHDAPSSRSIKHMVRGEIELLIIEKNK